MPEEVHDPITAMQAWSTATNTLASDQLRLDQALKALAFYAPQFIRQDHQTKAQEWIWVWSPEHGAQLWSGIGPIVTEQMLAVALDKLNLSRPAGTRERHIYFLAPLAPGEMEI